MKEVHPVQLYNIYQSDKHARIYLINIYNQLLKFIFIR